jgi:hypothetical protein
MSPIFDIVVELNQDNAYWIFYFINLIFAIAAYELGFAKKLSPVKTVIIYILLLLGNYIITIFSVLRMPMTESLIIITVVLAIYRTRLHYQRKARKEN